MQRLKPLFKPLASKEAQLTNATTIMASTQTEEHTAWNTLIADAANDKASALATQTARLEKEHQTRVTDLVTAEQNARPALEQDNKRLWKDCPLKSRITSPASE